MNKITIAVAALAIAAMATAQDNNVAMPQNSGMIYSGPWMLRKSTGDKATDRLYFIMDRTLNAGDAMTLRDMFNSMNPNVAHTLQKAILNAIDNSNTAYSNYGTWSSADWMSNNGMTDLECYDAMDKGLSWWEKGTLHSWEANATASQLDAVGHLIRRAGWANNMWNTSGMNNG